MSPRPTLWLNLLIIPIVLLAAGLRLFGNDWDAYEHFHPDERYISWVAATIERPSTLDEAFDPHRSTLNLFYWPAIDTTAGIKVPQDEPRNFAYGHLPIYATVLVTRLLEQIPPFGDTGFINQKLLNGAELIEFDYVTVIGRAMAAVVDALTVLLIFRLGKIVFDVKVGLLAAVLLALTVMHIQSAHFFITDPWMALFVVAAILNMVKAINGGRLSLGAAALFTGLAVGSKFSAIMLGLPLLVTAVIVHNERNYRTSRIIFSTLLVLLLAAGTFVLTNPFAVLDWTCDAITPAFWNIPEINWGSCYLFNVAKQSSMVSGAGDVPFTRQYTGTLPFIYFGEMVARWGMGWPLAIASLVGIVWSFWAALRHTEQKMSHLIIYLWIIPFALVSGRFFVKFMRYLLPLTPFLVLYAAAMLSAVRWKWLRRGLIAVVVASTAVYAFAFVNLYRDPHPWMTASAWVYENVPDGAIITTEIWGDRLPVRYWVDDERFAPEERGYVIDQKVNWLSYVDTLDTEDKLRENFEKMATADYYIIDSNRTYGVVSRLPGRYPLTSQLYARLFDGSLGYEIVFVANRAPHLGEWHLQPDFFTWATLPQPDAVRDLFASRRTINGGRTDESFALYDQSLTMVFENVGQLSAEQMLKTIIDSDSEK